MAIVYAPLDVPTLVRTGRGFCLALEARCFSNCSVSSCRSSSAALGSFCARVGWLSCTTACLGGCCCWGGGLGGALAAPITAAGGMPREMGRDCWGGGGDGVSAAGRGAACVGCDAWGRGDGEGRGCGVGGDWEMAPEYDGAVPVASCVMVYGMCCMCLATPLPVQSSPRQTAGAGPRAVTGASCAPRSA